MERTAPEIQVDESNDADVAFRELNEMQLALIGGGSADPIFH